MPRLRQCENDHSSFIGPMLVLVWVASLLGTPLAGSASESFRLKQFTLNAGGSDVMTSLHHRVASSIGQESAIGTSASGLPSPPDLILQSGFWSFLGHGLVPVVLSVARSAVAPNTQADLSWTGSASPYDVYWATDCGQVFDGLTVSTDQKQVTVGGLPVPAENETLLVCFNVLDRGSSGPGPTPLIDIQP